MKKYKVLGYLIITFGLLFNEFTIKIITNNNSKFATIDRSIVLILFQIVVIFIGYYIIKVKKKAFLNLITLFLSFFVVFTFVEFTLSYLWKADLQGDQPLWIPYKYKKINREINIRHKNNALKNRFGFNDINYPPKKLREGDFRIAVLGDSFIWGVGVNDSIIWTNKLKKLLLKKYKNTFLLNWGKPGWSTLDQFNFLKEYGKNYEFDFLIFTFVINDPVLDQIHPRLFIMPDGFVDKMLSKTLGIIFPRTTNFSIDLINNFFANNLNYGFADWLDSILYTKSNLEKYSLLLNKIDSYCKEKGFSYIFILTPANNNIVHKHYFNKIIPLLKKNKIKYLNLFPIVKNELKNYSIRQLWANPADDHPGSLVTSVYAKHTFKYLMNSTKFLKVLETLDHEKE